VEVAMVNHGNRLSGSFMPGAKAQTVLLVFQAGERWLNNKGEGYFITLYDGAGKPKAEGPAAQAALYSMGYFDLDRKPAVMLGLLEKAFAAQPSLKEQYFAAYVNNLASVRRDAGKQEGLAFLGKLEKTLKDEAKLIRVADLYERHGSADQANALRQRLRTEFPKGALVRKERKAKIMDQTDLAAYEAAVEAYQKEFAANFKEDEGKKDVAQLYNRLARKYAEDNQWEPFRRITKTLDEGERAALYNDQAWKLAEGGKDLQQAKVLAAEATAWADRQLVAPTGERRLGLTAAGWMKNRQYNLAQYADTYAFVLDKLGDPAAAAAWQSRAVEYTEGADAEMNERYIGYLERNASPELRYRLEGFIMNGHATPAMKEQFKRLYLAENRTDAGAAAYLEGLEKMARENLRKDLSGQMLDQPAPAFSLKNLAGETVSLESLRGKVVVVDFWATWCGPCKMSFPGMQQALNEYKNDPSVAFVFIDCWERGTGDKAKNAADFIASKSYTFNVLMDNDDQVVSSFGVSGIPTKFVLDQNGRIRFKAVGYNGSNEALVEELKLMIELTKKGT
jgi:thiol-disulfide isomerase/thioredoxin